MIDPINRVFTNVKAYVLSQYPNVTVKNSRTATPSEVPAMCVIQIDMPEIGIGLDEGSFNDDVAITSTVEIQTYSNKSISEAKNLIVAGCKAMRAMSFERIYGISDLPDSSSPNVYRFVARFRRIIHSLDDVPRFVIPTT